MEKLNRETYFVNCCQTWHRQNLIISPELPINIPQKPRTCLLNELEWYRELQPVCCSLLQDFLNLYLLNYSSFINVMCRWGSNYLTASLIFRFASTERFALFRDYLPKLPCYLGTSSCQCLVLPATFPKGGRCHRRLHFPGVARRYQHSCPSPSLSPHHLWSQCLCSVW